MTTASGRGIWTALVTPVDATGVIDIARLAAHARWLLGQGCQGVLLFGTTGETAAFSVAERQAALEALLATGFPVDRLRVGVGCCARSDTVALTRHALAQGCHELLALPPFFFKSLPDEGLYRAFAETIDAVADPALALHLYHFPQVSAVPVTMPVIERLVAAYPDTVKGVKDSSGDLAHTLELVRRFPTLAIYAGADGHLLELLRAGGAGTISAAANLNAAANRAVLDAFERGDMAAAEALMQKVSAVRGVLNGRPLIPSIKAALAGALGEPTWRNVRAPFVEVEERAIPELLGALAAAGNVLAAEALRRAAA
jgi:4-hydroxy-tetrahydrodipicolinate synthase